LTLSECRHQLTRTPGWCGSAWTTRGIELEILALDLEGAVVVVHVMPTDLRR
jgi:hypothetical protein